MAEIFQVAQKPIYRKESLERSPAYRRWIKAQRCLACFKRYGIDPAHVGPHGVGIKSSDYTCIPLCRECHDKFDAAPARFAAKHHLDILDAIGRFNRTYNELQKKKERVA